MLSSSTCADDPPCFIPDHGYSDATGCNGVHWKSSASYTASIWPQETKHNNSYKISQYFSDLFEACHCSNSELAPFSLLIPFSVGEDCSIRRILSVVPGKYSFQNPVNVSPLSIGTFLASIPKHALLFYTLPSLPSWLFSFSSSSIFGLFGFCGGRFVGGGVCFIFCVALFACKHSSSQGYQLLLTQNTCFIPKLPPSSNSLQSVFFQRTTFGYQAALLAITSLFA